MTIGRPQFFSVMPKTKTKIENFQQWQRLWEIYTAIYILHPNLTLEAGSLLKYMQVVRDLADNGGDWLSYDEAFRTMREAMGWDWAFVPNELWNKASRPSSRKSALWESTPSN